MKNQVSIIKRFNQVIENRDLESVINEIANGKCKTEIEQIRELIKNGDEKEAKTIKKGLPGFTPSGTFKETRANLNLASYSGVVSLDIDNLSEKELESLKAIAKNDPNSLYVFISPSGNGFKMGVKVDSSGENHCQAFEQVKAHYLPLFGEKIDQLPDVARLCFMSYDPEAFYNPDSSVFHIEEIKENSFTTKNVSPIVIRKFVNRKADLFTNENLSSKIESCIAGLKSKGIDLTSSYGDWLKVGFAFASLGEEGRGYFRQVSSMNSKYESKKCDNKFDNLLKRHNGKSDISTFFYLCKLNGIPDLKELVLVPENSFPIHSFPDKIRLLLKEAERTLQFSPDYLGSSILFASSVGIGNTTKIKVKNEWDESAVVYIAIVGRAGENKSHPLSFALFSIEEMEKQSKKDSCDTNYKQFLISDVTLEALNVALSKNPRGLGLYRDELIGWLKDLNKYRSGSDQEAWMSSWSGKSIKVNRKSSAPIYIDNPFVSVAGTIQPAVVSEMAKDNKNDNGFIDRILFAFPDKKQNQYWTNGELDQKLKEDYHQMIKRLFTLTGISVIGREDKPNIMTLSCEANTEFIKWYNRNKELMGNPNTSDKARSLYSKLDMYVMRLALILQLMKWACDEEGKEAVSLDTMKGAIDLIEYFRYTGEKVSRIIGSNQNAPVRDNQIPEAIKLKKEGYSNVKIATTLGVSEGTVRYWFKTKS